MTDAEQMAIYNMQVLGLKAEVVQHFFAMATMAIACVAMVFAIVALFNYIKISRMEIAVLREDEMPETADTSYVTLNLADEDDDVQETAEETVEETVQESAE